MTDVRLWILWITISLGVGALVRVVRLYVLGRQPQRTIVTDIIQGFIVSGLLAYFTHT